MTLIDHYTKKEKQYRFLTIEEIKRLTGHALITGYNSNEVFRVKINGAVKIWKKQPDKFSVPVKYGLYEYGRTEDLNRFVIEI